MTVSKRKKALQKIVNSNNGKLPGRHLGLEELKVLAREENKEPCGWIRRHTYDGEVFYGTCGMRSDLGNRVPCDYPCTLPSWKYQSKYEDFQCPQYKYFMKRVSKP